MLYFAITLYTTISNIIGRQFCQCGAQREPDSDSEEEVSAVALELRRTLGLKGKAHKPRLTITQWLAAFERYALAAVITDQWSMVDSLAQYIYIYLFLYSYK
jgi:hypothetical protein